MTGRVLEDLVLVTKYFSYLDDLRESGITNMYGACPYLARAMHLKNNEANKILQVWMRSFSHEKTAAERAQSIIKELSK